MLTYTKTVSLATRLARPSLSRTSHHTPRILATWLSMLHSLT